MATDLATFSTACRSRRARRSKSPWSTGTGARARRDSSRWKKENCWLCDLSRDRDISEIANASVRENISGGSEAETSSFGGGLGIAAIIPPVGGLLGIGGGTSGASSSAWQNSSRSTSANTLQQLRDRAVQGASAVRNQRSTVVQTVRQGETMRVETSVVANHNHCHAITIEYFEGVAAFPRPPQPCARPRMLVRASAYVPLRFGQGASMARSVEPLPP